MEQYDVAGNPNKNPLCGKYMKCSYGSNSVRVQVVDRCPGCSYGGVDLSPAAFKVLAPVDKGRIDVTCEWD